MVVAIVAMAVGVSLLVGMAIMFLWSCARNNCYTNPKDPENLRKKFKGITSNPSFAAAIHASFANQQLHSAAILTMEEQFGEFDVCQVRRLS